MKIGQFNQLIVSNKNEHGYYLEDRNGACVFIAKLFAENHWQIGDEVKVFIYQDENEIKATIEEPFIQVGEFGILNCVQNLPAGSFMDWGIIKDLFVPYKQQRGKMVEGRNYLVYAYIDEETGRITGTTKLPKNNTTRDFPFKNGDKVELIIANTTDLGWNVIINRKYIGLLYNSEVFQNLRPMMETEGYIKNIREDGKIDVILQPVGFENIDAFQTKILEELDANYGILYLSDQSSPEDIKAELQMSKKNFKKAIGGLYKAKKIEILEDKIRLL